MESIILRGASASGLYVGRPQVAMYIQNIIMNLPTSGTLAAVAVTVSGSRSGAYTFSDSVVANVRFKPNEDVYITTTNFAANYGAVINYLEAGDPSSYMETDYSKSNFGYPVPWRFRT